MNHRGLACVLGLVCVATAVGLGCGGASSTDVAAPGDGGAGEAAASSSGASGSGSSSGGSSGTPNLGPDGGVNPADAGPGGDTTRVNCGATSCAIATEICCVTRRQNTVPPGASYGCVTGAACPVPPGGGDVSALKCSSAANCPAGTVCCVDQVNNGSTSACQASCGQGQAQLCDPAAGDAGGCAPNQPCSSNNIGDWGLPRSYATCGGKGN